MEDKKLIFDKSYAKQLDEQDLYNSLFKVWGISNGKIQVWGRLEINSEGNWAGIKQVKLIGTNEPIEYPLPKSKALQHGVFLSPIDARNALNGKNSVFIRCELKLASTQQREHKDNPFLLSIDPATVELLTELPKLKTDELIESDLSTLISEHIYGHFLTTLAKETQAAEEASLAKIKLLETEYKEIQQNLKLSKKQRLLTTCNNYLMLSKQD